MNKETKAGISLYLLAVLYIITGISGVIYPVVFSVYLIYILGAFFLLSGVINFIDGIKNLNNPAYHWGMSLFLGIIEIILSFSIFISPILSEVYLIVYIGILLLIRGLFIIFNSFGKKDELKTPHMSTAVVSILFGMLFVGIPMFSTELIVLAIAWFIIFSGVDLFIITMGMNKLYKE
ncbi:MULTISPECIES: HdeD family acid-resistance protein [Psychrilyobacter]|uniref:Acid-resistance membrane protein n=1 Tax=Psychrilyobacter piezotolerans TaxID=2293438 RepID=A0ABX9KEL0_9FUSO|nr:MULTISPECIES: DUF308 domain-containing protein [Psychrilyobacter]MCS5420824.1 DUF308 domain-containing protein [Psychrilyobacter sp. S5]NDI79132.1 hypothetical protein [Psychrilyobacter piezotolerans]RDE59775.1 hypothetical protein DV867_12190 [Psychrilyobacter sp. S5]REI40101.1 hypothetical protein DYH56_12190 [Psychrilyobacter piezotolerans]